MVSILSIVYYEPDWQETKRCIEAAGLPTVYQERHGVGSLAEAINAGIKKIQTDMVWIVTNIDFRPGTAMLLAHALHDSGYTALNPVYLSDHYFLRPGSGQHGIKEVPFIEFTAPIVYTDALRKFPLDEDMPYWGHDLDFSYRVKQAGGKVGVCKDISVFHTYIRFKDQQNVWTMNRQLLRTMSNAETSAALDKKYGPNARKLLQYNYK